MDKQQFTMSKADLNLLNVVDREYFEDHHRFGTEHSNKLHAIATFWTALGEKYGFDPATAVAIPNIKPAEWRTERRFMAVPKPRFVVTEEVVHERTMYHCTDTLLSISLGISPYKEEIQYLCDGRNRVIRPPMPETP